MKKIHVVLLIYDYLNKQRSININDIADMANCSKRTAIRYINDIREYFSVFHINKEIVYDRQKKVLFLEVVNFIKTIQYDCLFICLII